MLHRLRERVNRFIDLRQTDAEAVFTRIYRRNRWGNGESVSGPGSSRTQAAGFIPDLLALISSLNVRVLLDAPCGDMNWIGAVADSVEQYIGVDIVRELIERNAAEHGGHGHRFIHADFIRDPLPQADLIFCRDGLVHFCDEDVWKALLNFKLSGSTFLLATTFVDRNKNAPIATGEWRPLNLEAAPFLLPAPIALVDERCLHTNGIYRDKRLALWNLESISDAA